MKFRERFSWAAGSLGFHPPGRLNSLEDVPGVRVGHSTLSQSPYFTGVTLIQPASDVYFRRPFASGFTLHGAGEVTGLSQILEWGVLETPILLGSSLNIGRIHHEWTQLTLERHPEIGIEHEVILPVVAECDDSFVSQSRDAITGKDSVREAWQNMDSTCAEGSVGAGTGMAAFDFKAGIGSSSRRISVPELQQEFTLGILVNANVGVRRHLRILGYPAGRWFLNHFGGTALAETPRPDFQEKSIIAVLATDAPFRPDQLRRICTRAALGFAQAGSFASHSSGEFVIGFTTSAGEPRTAARTLSGTPPQFENLAPISSRFLNPFYEAAVEATNEAILNSLSAATGVHNLTTGRRLHPFPWNDFEPTLRRYLSGI